MTQIQTTLLTGTAALLALALMPAPAQAQLIGNLDNSTLLGGAVGAGLGGVIGSNIAPDGQGDEYTAIGAVAGGLAGAAYGNSRSTYAGNPYAGQFNPGFNSRNLVGTAIGAGVGGAIGSNLAGSGQRQEGTAIGAVLGGAAGYSLATRTARPRYYGPSYSGNVYSGGSYGVGYRGAPYVDGQAGIGASLGYGSGFNGVTGSYSTSPYVSSSYSGGTVSIPTTYRGTAYTGQVGIPTNYRGSASRFQRIPIPSPAIGSPAPGPFYGPLTGLNTGPVLPTAPGSYHKGEYIAGPVTPVTTYAPSCGSPCAPTPKIRVQREIIRKERVVVKADCPQGTYEQADGTCMTPPRTVYEPAPTVIPSHCPAGTTDQGDGTCLEPAKTVLGQAPIVIKQHCPAGTSDLGDGTCLEPAKTVLGQAPIVIPQSCPVGTTDQGDGTCLEPAKTVLGQAPIVIEQHCPAGTSDQGNGTCLSSPKVIVEPAPIVRRAPEPQIYCYADSHKRYDGNGNLIGYEGYDYEEGRCKENN